MHPSPPRLLTSPGRLPRYRRADQPPAMRLTGRDLRILAHLARMRYLDREQIQRLEFGPLATSNAKRRLTLAFHSGLVGRRLLRTDEPYGSPRALYYLERPGERVLRDAGVRITSSGAKARRAQAEPFFLRHLMETNDVWIAALLSARRHGVNLTWHDELELRRELTGVRLGRSGTAAFMLAPIPDGYARLPVGNVELSFAVELDRGTVEEKRARKKFAAYGLFHNAAGAARGRPRPRGSSLSTDDVFVAGMRVLFVASGRDAGEELVRKRQLLRWCEQEAGGSLFWCATLADVRVNDLFTAPIWDVAGHPGRRRLVDRAELVPPPRLATSPRAR